LLPESPPCFPATRRLILKATGQLARPSRQCYIYFELHASATPYP
jgi:hypothetical protein